MGHVHGLYQPIRSIYLFKSIATNSSYCLIFVVLGCHGDGGVNQLSHICCGGRPYFCSQLVKHEEQKKQLENKVSQGKKVTKALEKELAKRADAVKKLEDDLKTSQDSVKSKDEEVCILIWLLLYIFMYVDLHV